MPMQIRNSTAPSMRLRQAWCACLVWLAACSATSAQQARFTGSWLDEGTDLLSAFRDVVAAARLSTVRVLVDEETVVLGTIVGSDGWIVTKGSEVEGAVRCRLPDGRELPAKSFGSDGDTDLTLLKVEATDLAAVRWSTAGAPAVGDWVATAGQDARPIAVGIVSVPRRSVPAEKISGVLGVVLESSRGAARIDRIIDESAAQAANLQAGDEIIRVGNRMIDSKRALIRTIGEHEPGTTLEIAVRRKGKELVLSATLTHPFGAFLSRIATQNQMGGALSRRRSGFPAVVQHDTVLQPEHCGGPIVNLDGDAVGINIARSGRTESFALPADVVAAVLEKLRSAARGEEELATDAAPDAPVDNDGSTRESDTQ